MDQFSGPGKYEAVFGDFLYGPDFPYAPPPAGYNSSIFRIGVYPFNQADIGSSPKQVIPGYFNSRPQYANINSYWGPANTHTYRLKVDDFNQAGVVCRTLWDWHRCGTAQALTPPPFRCFRTMGPQNVKMSATR